MMNPIRKISVHSLEGLVIALMATLVIDVTWQVISRYLLGNPSSWTDELATLLMIWVACLGASLGFIQHAHLGIDYFVHRLPPRAATFVRLFGQIMIGFFATAVLIYGGTELVRLTLRTDQVSPALGLKMGFVYAAIPLSGCYILASTLSDISDIFKDLKASPVPEEKAHGST